METKIIKAVFGGSRYTVTAKRTRTDYGQVLEFVGIDLPDTFECIFSNSATSAGVGKKMIGSAQRVLIPDEYLATGQTIYAWVLVHDSEDDGRHMYNVKIPVDDMPDLSPEEPTPVEQSVISQAIAALNSAVDTTTQKAQEASDNADRAEQAADGIEAYVERAESAQQAAESARDRAVEAETSARTSAATALEKASEAISSATTASQSALTAETASESAQASADASYQNAQTAYRYAQDSAASAEQAESYASGAGRYASDAQTHSRTASQKALEAAQSAQTATQAKTDAESAKTASETAQGLAESARDGAVTAKTDAESARDEAQEIVDGISGKVEQIDSNTERIESLEDDRYKPYVVDSASGAAASFSDGADNIPLKSCIVQVNPVQDLHGYDHPWPAGGGKNLLQNNHASEVIDGVTFTVHDDGTVTANGTASADIDFIIKSGLSLEAGSYVLSGCPAGGSTSTYRIFATNVGSDTGSSLAFTFNKTTATTVRINIKSGTAISNLLFKPMIRLASVSDDSYAPYSNECPISGFTGCEVQRTGKNLMPYPYSSESYAEGGITWTINEDGTVTVNGTTASNRYCWLYGSAKTPIPSWAKALAGKTVTVSAGNGSFVQQGYASMQMIFYGAPSLVIHEKTATIPSDLSSYTGFGCVLFVNGGNTVNTTVMPQIELGSTPTPYESYTGQTIPITFPSEAGTVYGAYVDVINGELVVDRAQIASYSGETLPSTWISDRDVYASGTTPTIGAQVVYKLAEPITYHLTSTEIKTLLGQNNLWADTGDTEVEYRADTELYVANIPLATISTDGLMSATDKTRLDDIYADYSSALTALGVI